jgi:hypothetical protein
MVECFDIYVVGFGFDPSGSLSLLHASLGVPTRLGIVDPGGYWWPPTYSTWIPTIVSFSFSVSLIVAQFTIFGSFLGLELPEPF